ncbi:MAG TPA: PAS domain S-box protein, partial [Roseiarcus sp.]|nr:PAS domain S-box protein [Roseiarcus sp.]
LRAQHLLWTSVSRFETAEYHFYAALSRAASCASAAAGERQQHLDALAAHHRQLEAWSENCPENFENRVALVGAELARLEGRELDAEQLYEQAIRSAQANSFVHNEALANELASRFYAARGLEKIARLLLQDARYCYLRWGADGKVRQLEEMYPHLRTTEETAPGPTSTIASPVERLDLATIIKVSQAVSGEMVLEKLIDTLMRTAIEQAGAERGLLILLQAAEPQIEAEATTSGDTVSVQLRDAPVTASVLPETVLHYVMHTRESVILDDAATQPSFAADPYVRQRQARSILCLPLINQGKLIGALYLENNLTPRAFAPARSAVLKLLASQAATSLENTRLYRNLEHREAKIRGLVDANIIGICVVESDRRILEANDAYLRIIGYDRDDLLSGRISWTDLTPPEWRDRSAQAVSELTTTGAVQPFEKEYIRKDGSRVPVLVGAAGIEGTECQHVAFVLDLTERERAEAELRASEELKRRIIESSRDCIKVLDLDGNLLFMSSSGGQQLLEIDDIQPYLNSCWIDFWQPEDRPKISEAVAAARAGGIGNFQAFCPSAKGAPRWWEVIITPICNADGQPEQLLSVSRDITERKRAEAESRANERRYREMQTELAHANRVATMGQLTASIAHEVNQPLAAARINAASGLRFLSRNPPDLEEVGEALERVVKNADRGGEIIGRIRALIKKAPPRKDGVAINDAILEVVALTRGEATKNGVSVRTRLAEGLPIIEGDRVQLQQVILNLIVNAIEAMSEANEAPRELLISTGKTEPDAVFVAVQDTGPGLTPENLERLFDAFYTTKVDGMGMGLSICRSIIEAHGGRLWATANSPHGAIFQFTVPAFPAIHDHLRASWRGRH